VIHLRIVSPPDLTDRATAALRHDAVINLVLLRGAALDPAGDLLMCDVAREDASVVIADLRDLGLEDRGTIAIEAIDSSPSKRARQAERLSAGDPADAVVWEEVEARTSDESRLSATFLLFMVLAALIGMSGILLNNPILIVGAMVVGPEFGPLAGLCVAAVQGRRRAALSSAAALAIGMVLALVTALLATLALRGLGLIPDGFNPSGGVADLIASPDFYAFFVAACAGAAGMISLTTAKSGALIGVLISVTTIPAASDAGVGAALGHRDELLGSLGQLGINLATLVVVGIITLAIQRSVYERRRARHKARARSA
jgi:uncharacterized hydrophobic protein (TIGR00271 family)